jgi:hypothetical protein
MAIGIDVNVSSFIERGRKRKAAMGLGQAITKPEVLEQVTDPQLKAVLGAIGGRLASGDIFVEEATKFLEAIPGQTFKQAGNVPPEVLNAITQGGVRGKLGFGPSGMTAEVEPFNLDLIRQEAEAKETPLEQAQKAASLEKTQTESAQKRAEIEAGIRPPAVGDVFTGKQKRKNTALLIGLLQGKTPEAARKDLSARIRRKQITAKEANEILRQLFPDAAFTTPGAKKKQPTKEE